ncbi:MAG: DUF4091 domain-containing protein [Verrucomicrobia bacterium]|nr:DUF4091 domain-containing protein [Verrucomicrobiota bacterium]OQC24287.1 MAG: hypothetical protein BWX68_02306 [Verrucomicrobia bacterium ADurb.Bin063]MBP8015337.1 DUF4091 domain-containing protein [Verrucomicrobiota bacterium]MDI9372813.1 DUF6067 family protein [Verrucomicrobiota bacterium]HNW07956.1 DUF6067 family protein [Verrucomicrobiota bacterium]
MHDWINYRSERKRSLWKALVFLAGAAVIGLAPSALARKPSYQLWAVSPLTKVLQDQARPTNAWDRIALYAAKGESEAGQVVISAGSEPLKDVRVSLEPLTGPGGAITQIELSKVVYINLPNLKKIVPDALPPATPFEVAAHSNQPIWITLIIPRDTRPGVYSGKLVVKPANAAKQRIPIRLKVWNFTLPETPSHKTAFGISRNLLPRQHGVLKGSEAAEQLYARYYNFLLDRWISAYWLPPAVTAPEAERYIRDPRVTGFLIPYNDDVEEMRKSVQSLRRRGLLDKAYFYPVDEPYTEPHYKRLVEVCTKIHSIDPKLRITIPYYRDPSFDTGGKTLHELADGLINIWCPNIWYFNENKERLFAKLAKGEEFWWYVCCDPAPPYPNYFLNLDGPSHRVLPWMGWKYRCQGLLYWNTTWWDEGKNGTEDPWTDMATVKGINKNMYGDGSLLYPGKKVGVDGPVSSIRLELLREGLQDYEYLVKLEQKIGRAATEKFVSQLVTNPMDFNHNVDDWVRVRVAIGEELGK